MQRNKLTSRTGFFALMAMAKRSVRKRKCTMMESPHKEHSMMRRISLLIIGGTLAAQGQVLKTQDISPDGSNFVFTGEIGPGGRVKSLVIDPHHDDTLYAATEFAGVWKSTTGFRSKKDSSGSMKWFQSSKGLRNGLTVNQYSLAVDQTDSKRLLYASGDDDGRPPTAAGAHRLGGLWISLDAADHWSHVKLCPASMDDGVSSVVFAGGRPFVATICGIWTNKSTLDSSSWTLMKGVPFGAGAFLVDGGEKNLLACSGSQVFRTPDLGTTWAGMSIPGSCLALTVVPHNGSTDYDVAVVREDGASKEVTVVDFTTSKTANLGFGSVAVPGSGVAAIAAVQNPSLPLLVPIPGDTYDLYAADSLNWYEYGLSAPHWRILPSNVHVDTWAMAIPSWYDPAKGHCAAYAANDGGVFFNLGNPGVSLTGGGCATAPWVAAMNGLHVLEATQVSAITTGSVPYTKSALPLTIYLPTGDNDVFVMDTAQCLPGLPGPFPCIPLPPIWQNLNTLGDAGQALVDPAYPEQVLLSRNNNYQAWRDPPSIGGNVTQMIPFKFLAPGEGFDNGGQSVGTFDLAAIMTTPGELSSPVSKNDYLAVDDLDAWTGSSGCSPTKIEYVVRNRSYPPSPSVWSDLSPNDHFLSCDIAKVQPSGGHSTGLNVYLLTTLKSYATFNSGRGPGQIYRGVIGEDGTIQQWAPASGDETNPLGLADNFYVNPFDPSELYAVDVQDQAIKVSRDYGATWHTESTLTDIATNHGEYEIGCLGGRGAGQPSDPFTNVCSIAWIDFDVFHTKMRVASAAYGGIAISRDDGFHWMALDVTDNNHLVSDNLTEIVAGVAFDGETPIPGLAASDQVIYAGLKGHSLIRVEGPFRTLEALNFVYTPTVSPITSISVDVSTLGETIKLRKDPDGKYRGTALFDSKVYKTLSYSLTVDGVLFTSKTYTLTATDIANGVATAPL